MPAAPADVVALPGPVVWKCASPGARVALLWCSCSSCTRPEPGEQKNQAEGPRPENVRSCCSSLDPNRSDASIYPDSQTVRTTPRDIDWGVKPPLLDSQSCLRVASRRKGPPDDNHRRGTRAGGRRHPVTPPARACDRTGLRRRREVTLSSCGGRRRDPERSGERSARRVPDAAGGQTGTSSPAVGLIMSAPEAIFGQLRHRRGVRAHLEPCPGAGTDSDGRQRPYSETPRRGRRHVLRERLPPVSAAW